MKKISNYIYGLDTTGWKFQPRKLKVWDIQLNFELVHASVKALELNIKM